MEALPVIPIVAQFLDSSSALRLLRSWKGARAGSLTPAGKYRLWTFDCCGDRQERALSSRCDPGSVRVLRVHLRVGDRDGYGAALRASRGAVRTSTWDDATWTAQDGKFYFRKSNFANCEAVCVVGAPRRSRMCQVHAGAALAAGLGLDLRGRGNVLTRASGICAVFAVAARPLCFRLRVGDHGETFTCAFAAGGHRHGSSNFCRVGGGDGSDSDDSSDADSDGETVDARVDVLRVLDASGFRIDDVAPSTVEWVLDASIGADFYDGDRRDAISGPRVVFGAFRLLLFPHGIEGRRRDRAAFFLRLELYGVVLPTETRRYDVAIDGAHVGTIAHKFALDDELAGLVDVGASADLFGRRRRLVVRITERAAGEPPRDDDGATVTMGAWTYRKAVATRDGAHLRPAATKSILRASSGFGGSFEA